MFDIPPQAPLNYPMVNGTSINRNTRALHKQLRQARSKSTIRNPSITGRVLGATCSPGWNIVIMVSVVVELYLWSRFVQLCFPTESMNRHTAILSLCCVEDRMFTEVQLVHCNTLLCLSGCTAGKGTYVLVGLHW